VCIPTASAGGDQLATPAAFSATVSLVESTVNVAVPVAFPSVFPVPAFTPIGWIFSVKGAL
jgi:hypothetical protein